MTMDRSLKGRGGLKGSRSVLSRAERIAKMQEEDRFNPETSSPFGLPKMRVRITKAGSKAKKEEGAEGAEGAAPAAATAAAGKKPDAKKPDAKKADAKKPEAKKPEAKKK